MNIAEVVLFLATCLLGVALANEWTDTRTLIFRNKMFDIRGRLFLEAASGRIAFDHPAYGLLRRTMNGALRFAPRMNLTTIILMSLQRDRHHPRFSDDFGNATQALEPRQVELLTRYSDEVARAFFEFVRDRNPLLFPLTRLVRGIHWVQRRLVSVAAQAQGIAMVEGRNVGAVAA